MAPDVLQLLRTLRVPEFRYRDFTSHAQRRTARPPARPFTVVAVVSLLPGVGRTTVVAALTSALGRRGHRAAAFELDPSNRLPSHFRDAVPGAGLVRWGPHRAGYIPFGEDPAHVLSPLATECEAVVLDMPAGDSAVVRRALTGADEVVAVVRPDGPSCASLPRLESLLACRGWRATPARYVVNQFDARRAVDHAALATLRRTLGARLILPPIQQDTAVAAAARAGRTIFEEAPASQVVADLRALSRELIPSPKKAER
jgi:cellulose biosynthesis protein BcsQ